MSIQNGWLTIRARPAPAIEGVDSRAKGRLTWIMLFCLAVATALLGRAVWLTISSNPRLEAMARRQFQTRFLIQPKRGAILDRGGEALAINSEAQSLAMNPSKIEDRRTVAKLLSRATDIPFARILERMGGPKREFAWIKRRLNENDINRLKRWHVINSEGDPISGLWLVRESERVYPHGELASHVIGAVDLDSEGREGIELLENERLRGKIVSMSAIKDAYGRPAFIDVSGANAGVDGDSLKDGQKEGKDGESVTLTLDASLQFAVEEELKEAVQKTGARGGSVIAMNAVNGEILAMANAPTYNPNDRFSLADRRRNRALTDGFEPGSTMKAILLATALSKGMHLSDTVWGERGHFKLQGRVISEAEAHEKFEWLSLKKIITVSSNIGAAKLALKVGAESFYNSLRNFGFGSKTGTDFPGEISGRLPPRKSWQPLTTANIGFGQGILVTPLQMIRAYAAFANGGWLVQPTLLKDPQAKSLPPRRVVSEQVAALVTEALESTTHKEWGGTGSKAVLTGYRVAGKTGTAQKVDPASGRYSRTRHMASFIGYPLFDGSRLRDTPRVVILALLDEPEGLAGATAAPLFHEVLNAVASRFSLPSNLTNGSEPPGGVKPKMALSDSLAVSQASAHFSVTPPSPRPPALESLEWEGKAADGRSLWMMPSVQGLTVFEAMEVLKGREFQLEIRGQGIVELQRPEAGRAIAEGDTVKLTLGDPKEWAH